MSRAGFTSHMRSAANDALTEARPDVVYSSKPGVAHVGVTIAHDVAGSLVTH
jgi:hypothetical protein